LWTRPHRLRDNNNNSSSSNNNINNNKHNNNDNNNSNNNYSGPNATGRILTMSGSIPVRDSSPTLWAELFFIKSVLLNPYPVIPPYYGYGHHILDSGRPSNTNLLT
jgi:hypothetical protein